MANEQEGPPPIWYQAPPVEFKPGGDSKSSQSILILARQSAAFPVAAGLLGHALASRATDVLLDYTAQGVALRYQIDGMWEQLPGMDRLTGDAMLVVLKQVTRLNPADRRTRQAGDVEIKLGRDKIKGQLQSQGVATGERVLIHFAPTKLPFSNLTDLGMRDKMQESLREALNSGGGLVLFSAPKGQGLTTIWNIGLQAADRFIRDFQSIEDKSLGEPEIINVNSNFFDPSAGHSAEEALRQLILREPDVFVLPDLVSDDLIKTLQDQAKSRDTHAVTRIVANDAIDGVLKLLAQFKKSSPALLSMLTAVTGQRLVRRLCDTCKQAFQPQPELLKKLGIPPGRITALYRQYVPPPIEQQVDEKGNPAPIPPCPQCGGRGFFGRVGIFELITFSPEIREVFSKTSDPNKIRQALRPLGQRSLQEEAVLTVARGLTSLEEVRRVFSGAAS